MNICGLDHVVLTVASIEASCRFYETALAMTRESFGDGRMAVRFGDQKLNLHQSGNEFEPKSGAPMAGSGDLCFVESNLEGTMAHLAKCGIAIELGPVRRIGARGDMMSIYLRDPDGNLIELAQYD